MIRTLLATTAMAAMLSTGAFAQSATSAPATENAAPVTAVDGHLASNIIGETVYNGTEPTAEKIGAVSPFEITELTNIDGIITTAKADATILCSLRDVGCELIFA